MAISASLEQIAAQKSGRYITWLTQSEGVIASNNRLAILGEGMGPSGSYQLGKLVVNLTGNVTASYRLQYRYNGSDIYADVDNSERVSVKYPKVYQIDISAVDGVYVNIYSMTIGSGGGGADIYMAVAEDGPS